MSRRVTLHIPDLEAFQHYLIAAGVRWKPGVARYEALQAWVKYQGEFSWAHVYEVQDRPGYFTAPEKFLRTYQLWEKSQCESKTT